MNNVNKVLDNLRRQCSRREYCESDVLNKAEKALDGDKEQALHIVQKLVEEKYVDNLRYSSAYAREKSSISGWGEVKIRYMLSAKGVSKEVISRALEEIDRQRADSRLEKLLENKGKNELLAFVGDGINDAPVLTRADIGIAMENETSALCPRKGILLR